MVKIVTAGQIDYSLRDKRKTILDRLEDNRTFSGDIMCIACNSFNLKETEEEVIVSEGVGEKKHIKLNTLRCALCSYELIDDKEVEFIRKQFK